MAVLTITPGQSPESPGVLAFFKQGYPTASGFQVTTEGVITGTLAVNGSSVALTGATAGTPVLTTQVSGDTGTRLTINADGGLHLADGTNPADVNITRTGAAALTLDAAVTITGYVVLPSAQTNGNLTVFGTALTLGTAGGGLQIKEGTNATMGLATLAAGTVTVNTTKVTANTRIFLTAQSTGAAPGALRISGRTAGTSFTITSTSGTDTSTVAWFLVEPQ